VDKRRAYVSASSLPLLMTSLSSTSRPTISTRSPGKCWSTLSSSTKVHFWLSLTTVSLSSSSTSDSGSAKRKPSASTTAPSANTSNNHKIQNKFEALPRTWEKYDVICTRFNLVLYILHNYSIVHEVLLSSKGRIMPHSKPIFFESDRLKLVALQDKSVKVHVQRKLGRGKPTENFEIVVDKKEFSRVHRQQLGNSIKPGARLLRGNGYLYPAAA
jgi:hypothetical protein